jgi:hypothetical protein
LIVYWKLKKYCVAVFVENYNNMQYAVLAIGKNFGLDLAKTTVAESKSTADCKLEYQKNFCVVPP